MDPEVEPAGFELAVRAARVDTEEGVTHSEPGARKQAHVRLVRAGPGSRVQGSSLVRRTADGGRGGDDLRVDELVLSLKGAEALKDPLVQPVHEIGRASCRERV